MAVSNEIVRADGSATPATAADVVAGVMDVFAIKTVPVQARHRAILGKQAKELLDDGYDWQLLVVAAVTALRRGAPQNMHFIANDLAMAQAGEYISWAAYRRGLTETQHRAKLATNPELARIQEILEGGLR